MSAIERHPVTRRLDQEDKGRADLTRTIETPAEMVEAGVDQAAQSEHLIKFAQTEMEAGIALAEHDAAEALQQESNS
jgi:hypothetical protein